MCLHSQPSVSGEVMVSPSYLSWWHCNYGGNLPPWNETIDIPEADEAQLWMDSVTRGWFFRWRSDPLLWVYWCLTHSQHTPSVRLQVINHRLPALNLPCAKGDGVDDGRRNREDRCVAQKLVFDLYSALEFSSSHQTDWEIGSLREIHACEASTDASAC